MKELFESTESPKPDRFFWGGIDTQPTLFVLRADHSISIAPVAPGLGSIESLAEVFSSLTNSNGLW